MRNIFQSSIQSRWFVDLLFSRWSLTSLASSTSRVGYLADSDELWRRTCVASHPHQSCLLCLMLINTRIFKNWSRPLLCLQGQGDTALTSDSFKEAGWILLESATPLFWVRPPSVYHKDCQENKEEMADYIGGGLMSQMVCAEPDLLSRQRWRLSQLFFLKNLQAIIWLIGYIDYFCRALHTNHRTFHQTSKILVNYLQKKPVTWQTKKCYNIL